MCVIGWVGPQCTRLWDLPLVGFAIGVFFAGGVICARVGGSGSGLAGSRSTGLEV